MNERIRAREVRLVDPDGNQLGIKLLPEALSIAREMDLDLVEVAPLANPPVCRIMDYGKFKFDEAQRLRESRRKGASGGIKEMKYRPKIGNGDFDTKTRQVGKFLQDGHKVKITIMFRGREVYHPELGRKILDRIAEKMEGAAKIESEARLDGRNMVMVLAPDRRSTKPVAPKSDAQRVEGSQRRTRAVAPESAEAGEPAPALAEAALAEAELVEEPVVVEATAPAEEVVEDTAPASDAGEGKD